MPAHHSRVPCSPLLPAVLCWGHSPLFRYLGRRLRSVGHGSGRQVGWCRAGLGVRCPCACSGWVFTAAWTLPLRPGSRSWGHFTCQATLPSPGAPVRPWPFQGAFLLSARDLLPPKFRFAVIPWSLGSTGRLDRCLYHTLSSEANQTVGPTRPSRITSAWRVSLRGLLGSRPSASGSGQLPHIHAGPP